MHSSLVFSLNWGLVVWALTAPLQHLHSFSSDIQLLLLSQRLLYLCMTRSESSSRHQIGSHLTPKYFGKQTCKTSSATYPGPVVWRTSPNHQPSTIMLDDYHVLPALIFCFLVFFYSMWCFALWPNIITLVLIYPNNILLEVLWVV